jgi:glycosyltransferase involved in cell wall biosynthesis
MSTLIYLAWGRVQRPRANLIQTLHTVEALTDLGIATRLYVPPVPRRLDRADFFRRMGLHRPVDLRGALSLHRRWGGWPFAFLHHHELRRADAVYTRVPQVTLALARTGIRHWHEVHDTATLEKRGLLVPLLAACRAGRVLGLVAISGASRDALIAAGADPASVHVLPSGADLAAFGAVPALRLERLASPRAVYVGRISRDRGLGILEQVARDGCPVRLVGPADDAPAAGVPGLEVAAPVPHVGVPACYAAAELALMPYQADLQHAASISPIKLFEAMAAGRVVIASDLAPIREVITHGVDGLLASPTDVAAWRDAIAWVRAHPQAALAIGQTGQRRAAEFSWQARGRRLAALLGLR